MSWNRVFKAQAYGRPTYKHKDYPIYLTDEFDFYRCVEFNESFYGKTASELFNGNLRFCTGRYSTLFPRQKISYWADSPETARAEIKKHGAGNDLLTFWAYDDATSFIPIMGFDEPLRILDGRKCGVQDLIDKIDGGQSLTDEEKAYMSGILFENIDAIAYDSHAKAEGENFIFLESGFKKLALRELRLRFGKKNGGNHTFIACADTCDYTPFPESYGEMFMPKCRVVSDPTYVASDEYRIRTENEHKSWKRKFGESDD